MITRRSQLKGGTFKKPARRFPLPQCHDKPVDNTPTEVIDTDSHIPKEGQLLQPWVAGLTQDEQKRIIGINGSTICLLLPFRSC